MRTRVDRFRVGLLGALGLVPWVACGGETEASKGTAESAGNTPAGKLGQSGSQSQSGAGAGGAPSGGRGSGGRANGGNANSGNAGTGVGGAGAAAGSGGNRAVGFPCENERPLEGDRSKSFFVCDGGFKHRARKTACPSELPREDPVPAFGAGGVGNGECTNDAECTEHEHGYCAPYSGEGVRPPGNHCQYGCVTDEDCGTGSLCECGELIGECVGTACVEDAECGPGLLCTSYPDSAGCDFPAYACQTPEDRCASNDECAADERCSIPDGGQKNGIRECVEALCAIGRPFIVAGQERVASAVRRADWSESLPPPDVAALDDRTRQRLTEAWSRVGGLEHASIAAFARFTLELLAYGAPEELVTETARAMADETRHARMAYTLASAYAGTRLGPGELQVQDCLERFDLDASVLSAFVEGCIGETIAAVEAAEALSAARDPAVRAVLTQVEQDETRHAELAWRFLKWALPRLHPETLGRLRERLSAAQRDVSPLSGATESERRDVALSEHGVLDPSVRREVRRVALTQIVAPCFEHLLATVTVGERGQGAFPVAIGAVG